MWTSSYHSLPVKVCITSIRAPYEGIDFAMSSLTAGLWVLHSVRLSLWRDVVGFEWIKNEDGDGAPLCRRGAVNSIDRVPVCTIWAGHWHNQLTGVKATLHYFLIIDWPFVEAELSCVHVIRLCQPPLPPLGERHWSVFLPDRTISSHLCLWGFNFALQPTVGT